MRIINIAERFLHTYIAIIRLQNRKGTDLADIHVVFLSMFAKACRTRQESIN